MAHIKTSAITTAAMMAAAAIAFFLFKFSVLTVAQMNFPQHFSVIRKKNQFASNEGEKKAHTKTKQIAQITVGSSNVHDGIDSSLCMQSIHSFLHICKANGKKSLGSIKMGLFNLCQFNFRVCLCARYIFVKIMDNFVPNAKL